MDLKLFILLVQVFLFCFQIYSFALCIKQEKGAFDVHLGFSVWGCIPNIALMLVVISL